MAQNEGESITHFLSRLRSQVKFCEFNIRCLNEQTCGQQVDYSEDIVAGQMIAGLANLEQLSRILAKTTSLVWFALKRQTSRSLTSRMLCTLLHHLKYKSRTRNDCPWRPRPSRLRDIWNPAADGERLHIQGWGSINWKDCPAVKLKCRSCGRTGHVKKVYRKFVKSEAEATSRALKSKESFMFMKSHLCVLGGGGQITHKINRHNNMGLTNVPHRELNGERFQRSSPELRPSVVAEISMMPGI